MPSLEESTNIVQLKVRLLVPAFVTLRELHGILQVSMGWEGIHLYHFDIHAVHYAGQSHFNDASSGLSPSLMIGSSKTNDSSEEPRPWRACPSRLMSPSDAKKPLRGRSRRGGWQVLITLRYVTLISFRNMPL